ncbi:MAG: lysophospholipid acyltransferase family protein [Candidatus Aminicenantes bacterium]|nr:lysophospholipid acyltransferase family protein [Candidatus Aminicenantes bacterium]
MLRKKISFKHRLEYSLFVAVIFLIKYSPAWCVAGWSRALVFFLKKGSRKHARLIAENLAAAFPAASAESLADLQKKIYRHFGRMFVEIARTFARCDPQAVLSRSRILHPEVIERALQKKRGLVVFSAHFGNWEWIPLILHTHLGCDIHSIARPMDNPCLEKKVRAFREAMGSKIIYKKGSLRTILTRLGDNQIVYLLIDQNTVPREGVFVDFFARKASTNTAVAQLYLKKNIPVVPVFLHYDGDEIILDVLPEIDFRAAADGSDGLLELTQQMTGLIEAQIKKFPEQWLWFHDRWKTRPQGATK